VMKLDPVKHPWMTAPRYGIWPSVNSDRDGLVVAAISRDKIKRIGRRDAD
jgi:hypothetical protein